MSNIIIPGNPECPLCLKKMKKVQTSSGEYYACFTTTCMDGEIPMAIKVKDPAVNNWHLKKAPDCIVCGKPMRAFFRILEPYFKMQCGNCLKTRNKLIQVMRNPVSHNDPKWSVPA